MKLFPDSWEQCVPCMMLSMKESDNILSAWYKPLKELPYIYLLNYAQKSDSEIEVLPQILVEQF